MPKHHQYFVYILTDENRKHLYIGVTNSLRRRLQEHYENRGSRDCWTGKHHCYLLVYYEEYQWVQDAIDREKQLKNWRRDKKVWLIERDNPNWEFLNSIFN